MFLNLYKYRIKILLRTKPLLFWTLFFPILLAICFKMAFANLDSVNVLDTISIGIVSEDNSSSTENKQFKETLTNIKHENKQLFNVKELSTKEANQELTDKKIKGYYTISKSGINLTTGENGLEQTLMKSFVDQYLQSTETIKYLIKNNPNQPINKIISDSSPTTNFTKEGSFSENPPNSSFYYFYTLIAMACLYGAFWGLKNMHDGQADQSPLGIRITMAPVHKLKTILVNTLSSLSILFTEILLILAFLVFVLGVDFGSRWPEVLLTCFIASFMSIFFGTFIGALVKKDLKLKTSIVLSITMLLSFLSGMMSPDIKYLISKEAPILGYLNPVNLVSDALYKLFFYQNLTSFYINLICLAGFSIFFGVGSYLLVRRENYVSI